ncbi:MAG: T9SS type A sorting domain-containing protein, partial [Paludibacteraceae bacterium]|nr:T9SS type A sorting domain-containing protein [Paludibacteraceae bacterium]
DLYRYDEPSYTWQNAKNSANNGFNTIDPGRGYLYANAENTTLEFKGNINTETVTYNLTAKSDVLNGFHLVGNPFTHNITFAHLNATEGAELVNGYYVLNGEGAWGATLGSNEDDVIKVGQGVLVKAKSEGTLAISRQPSAVSRQRSGKGQQTTDNGQQSLCMSVSNAKYSDRAFVVFDKGVGLDKMNHENEDIPLLYIPMEDADYAIAMMDVNVNEIPVNFETNVMGQYTISLRQENCEFEELYLLDKETNTTVNILAEDYTFIATSSDSQERFILMKDNGQQTTDNRPWVYVNNGDIVIYDIEGDADIKIFDALGRCVYQGESSDETTRIANGYSAGVYMIQKVDDKGVNVQKIIL